MPSVSATRSSTSVCADRSPGFASEVRRWRSSASLTRIRSSLIAIDTVSSNARFLPARLPFACSSSASDGSSCSSWNVDLMSRTRWLSARVCAT